MIDLELGNEGQQRKFWMFTVVFLMSVGIFQLVLENYLMAVTSFGASITFAVLGHEKVKEEV